MLATPLGSRPGWRYSSNAGNRRRGSLVIGDMRQDMTQPNFGVDSVQLGRSDQPIHRGSAFATAASAGKEVVSSGQRDAAQRVFGGRVVDLDAIVIGIAGQRRQIEGP